ncbi:MAG: hypothetical protein ACR2KU_11520 [Gammaproteobacteria bacterium]
MGFLEELKEQRWDDHRYYHHSRINQSLHLFSACCFLSAYVLVFIDPVVAGLIGWLLAMTSRQAGHFFFEPKGYDHVNHATHEHKEAIKVGYNLRRKVVLHVIWALTPLMLLVEPSLFGLLEPHADTFGFVYNLAMLWIVLGLGAIAFRTVQLFFISGIQTGCAWAAKIFTDPLHDIWLYHRAPLQVLRGRLHDPVSSSDAG